MTTSGRFYDKPRPFRQKHSYLKKNQLTKNYNFDSQQPLKGAGYVLLYRQNYRNQEKILKKYFWFVMHIVFWLFTAMTIR